MRARHILVDNENVANDIIARLKKGEKFDPFDVPLSQNFQKHFFKASYDLGKDLFDHYPLSTVVNGVETKLRRISNKFDTLEDCINYYLNMLYNNYYSKGLTTPELINKRYAEDKSWASKVNKYIESIKKA